MIDRIHQRVVFICDDCDDTLETDEVALDDAVAVSRSRGWIARGGPGAWKHYCPDCGSGRSAFKPL